jgi:hypothetical protein
MPERLAPGDEDVQALQPALRVKHAEGQGSPTEGVNGPISQQVPPTRVRGLIRKQGRARSLCRWMTYTEQ